MGGFTPPPPGGVGRFQSYGTESNGVECAVRPEKTARCPLLLPQIQIGAVSSPPPSLTHSFTYKLGREPDLLTGG